MNAQTPVGSEPTLLPPPTVRSGGASADAATRELPARIGRYVVLDEVGAGGMGIVYAAYDPELDRKVAIKLMYGEADEARARRSEALLRREALALAKLSHPNIVAIHDVGTHAGRVFVTMEYVAGRNLRQWREEAPRSWRAIVAAFVQAGRGLMAAHALGLVHRDVKPDNLLIGDDGRVRVADFGVARFTTTGDDTLPAHGGRPFATVAGGGVLVGTPAYMAPEQHENVGVGPHSDQFSLCVALYEALFGARPFAGESSLSLLEAILRGAVERPSGPSGVPVWLERAVLRGLAARPEGRWPTLQLLLDVLAVDPEEQRARRRRRALYGGMALLCVGGLALGGRALVGAWARAQIERAAAERLAAVTEEVDLLLARGERAAAKEALHAFTTEPEHRETRAVLDAWLAWAERMEAAGDGEASLAALVEAYTALPPDDPREPQLFLKIGERFRDRWRFPELTALIGQAARRWPEGAATPAWADLRADAALARGDLLSYLAEIDSGLAGAERGRSAPVVRALAEFRVPALKGLDVRPIDRAGDGVIDLVVYEGQLSGQRLRIHDRTLAEVADFGIVPGFTGSPIGVQPLSRGPGEPGYLVGYDATSSEAELYEVGAAGPRVVYAWRDDRPQAAAAADLDGDGVRELYVGTGSYTRKLHRLTRDGAGEWRRESAHPATERLGSDVNALAVGDFDGDGRDELAVALGPWTAYDVRLLQAAPGGGIEVGARWRIGHVRALATLRGVDGSTLLAIAKDTGAPSKFVFPPHKPHGERAGLYVVRRVGDQLAPVHYSPFPEPEDAPHSGHPRWLGRGDFDGDGRDDLVLSYEPPVARRDFATALLWRQMEDGSFALAPVGGFFPIYAGDLDGDAADELVIKLEREGELRLAVLGAGGAPLEVGAAAPLRVAEPSLVDPVLARGWARAEDLASFGLFTAAGAALERWAALARSREEGRLVQRRAAELYTSAGDHARAGGVLERLAKEGDVAAGLAAVSAYEQARRFDDAQRTAEALLLRDDLTPAELAAAEAASERSAAIVGGRERIELSFDRGLAEDWRIAEPIGLRLDRVSRELVVEAFGDVGDLMTIPIELVGGPLVLELELEVERGEWGSSLAVELRRESGERVATLNVAAGGGGGELRRYCTLQSLDTGGRLDFGARVVEGPGLTSRHRLRLRLLPEQGKVDVEERGDSPGAAVMPLVQELRAGPHVLALRGGDTVSHGAQLMVARVSRISLSGVRPATRSPDDPRARAARTLVVADAPRLAAGDPPLWRAAAAIDRGDLEDARASLVLVDLTEPTSRARARHLLRTRPELAWPLIREVFGPASAELLREAFATAIRMHPDGSLQRLWLAAAADLEALPGAAPGQRVTKAELLRMRALVRRALGDFDRAAADLAGAVTLLAEGAARDDRIGELELLRAEIEVEGQRPAEALAAVERALARASEPAWMVERLQLSARLEPLQGEARWQRALASAR